ncbi:ALA-interacting subunit 1 [Physcomitrium patens]|uniref:ALA-interacting subunit n=1 Tax=Physcomitrium patens TaxID=3218 RepID=A0A2K1L0W2_PHYPA|nr:ALA-interacting subunit 1-like [Physcomitrium patens]XP_024368757.1 ALA-interacting subunit 1-like [Physcomitrium patens]PNR59664.1 hypothetical protein PHYPA_002456 [Physcomitrium patens]|eukprot:XP_024368756.1 ALA-interacting subunit 1-like [Physcomitrella patens]
MNGASSSEDGPTNLMKESKKPKYTKFTQQELPACKPLLTPGWVMATFMVVGIIFIPIGAVTLLASNSVVEVVHRYDMECLPSTLATKADRVSYIQNSAVDHSCNVTLTIPKRMKPPVYVYYELTNFYQNHRRYVKSRNDQQLRGDEVSSLDSCKPLDKVGNQTIVPCGLIAWSLFNDTYSFTTASGGILVEKTGIAWKSDVQSKFGSDVKPLFFPNNDRNGSLGVIGGAALDPNKPLRDAEDLIVWMRTAALPNFRKLWGRINQQLEANQTVTVGISNVYNTYTFKGSKKLVLSTTSWLGGKNSFLGIAYLTVGLICMFLALVFFLIHLKNPRPLGDTSYLSWNRKNASNNSRG